MANSRIDATLVRVGGLEKAIAEMKLQFQKRTDRIDALSSQLEDFMLEFRASPLKTFPKFDGSEALTWLAQANQYFLVNKTPLDRRVDVAIVAISGPAMPWLKLLLMRCSSLSWDKFTQELLRRFGDTIPPESRVTCNSSKGQHDLPPISAQPISEISVAAIYEAQPLQSQVHVSHIMDVASMVQDFNLSLPHPQHNNEAPIAAVRVAENHPKIPPTSNDNTAAILPSPPTVTAPLLSSSPPTTAMVTAPLLSSSPDIQIQPPCSPLLRCLVSAAGHQSTPTMNSFLGSPFASVGAPFSYLVMLRFLHIVGHLLWFDTLATTRKHEFEPPPNKVSILSSALRARLF